MAEHREDPPPERREVVERHEVVERDVAPVPASRGGGFDWIWVVLLVAVALVLGWFVLSRGQPLRWGEGGDVDLQMPRIETPAPERRIEIEVPQPAAPAPQPEPAPAPTDAPPAAEPPPSP